MTERVAVPMVRRNTVVFGTGPKGSGKTHTMNRFFVGHAPRVIHVDMVGEVIENYPDAIETVGARETILKLMEFARERRREWNLVAVFPEGRQRELAALCDALTPPYAGRAAQRVGVSRAFGGIALDCTECDILLPNAGGHDTRAARNMVKRARHELLDLFLATQRPPECSRLCTSQADIVFSLQTHEPRDLDYLRKGVGSAFADRVAELPQYHSLWFERATRKVVERGKDGAIVTHAAPLADA